VVFERALALWRGEPFAGIDTPWFAAERDSLRRQRITAELDGNDVALALGRPRTPIRTTSGSPAN
jgi:hypothetical protein